MALQLCHHAPLPLPHLPARNPPPPLCADQPSPPVTKSFVEVKKVDFLGLGFRNSP